MLCLPLSLKVFIYFILDSVPATRGFDLPSFLSWSMFYGVACQRPSTGELVHGVLSTTQIVTPAITRIIPRNVPIVIQNIIIFHKSQ